MHVNSILGDIHQLGHLDDAVFDLKDALLVEHDNNFFIPVLRRDGWILFNGGFDIIQSRTYEIINIFRESLFRIESRS